MPPAPMAAWISYGPSRVPAGSILAEPYRRWRNGVNGKRPAHAQSKVAVRDAGGLAMLAGGWLGVRAAMMLSRFVLFRHAERRDRFRRLVLRAVDGVAT